MPCSPRFHASFRATFVLNALDVDIGTTQCELAPLSDGSYFLFLTQRGHWDCDEQIDTISGPLQTTIVERSRKDKSRLTRIWCADLLNFLPVRLEQIEDDGTVQVTRTALEGFGLQ